MKEKLTSNELEIAELFFNPIANIETLFPGEVFNFSSLKKFPEVDEDKFKIRMYQFPMINYEYSFSNFSDKIKVGTKYVFCGRGIGKSLICQLIDLLLDALLNWNWTTIFSAFDEQHITPIMDAFIDVLDTHPFFKLFKFHTKRTPFYKVKQSETNHLTETVNMRVGSKKPGAGFERHHAQKIMIDEAQYETNEVLQKRARSVSELGAIEVLSGITSFRKAEPAGRVFFDFDKQSQIINLPEYVKPSWNEEEKQKCIKRYNGEDTIGYLTNVEAKVVENAEGLYDIQRIRDNCYLQKRTVKRFEINQDKFPIFEDLVVLERPKNCSRLWIANDYGEVCSEIIVIAEVERDDLDNSVFRYLYNITMRGLILEEQLKVWHFVIKHLSPDFVGIDCSDLGGRALYGSLSKFFPQDHISDVKFNGKVMVGFEHDANGKVVYDKGKPVEVFENTKDWSVKKAKEMLYGGRMKIPQDAKFDKQFNAMIVKMSGMRCTYGSSQEEHLHDSFLVFFITHFMNEQNVKKPKKQIEWGFGVSSWKMPESEGEK